MLTKVLKLQISFSIYLNILHMSCYECQDSQTTAYLLILIAKSSSFKTQLEDFFVPYSGHQKCLDKSLP